jgi:hypothetical protein
VKGLRQKAVWLVVLGGLFVLAFFTMSNGQTSNSNGSQKNAQIAAENESSGIFDNWGDSLSQVSGGGQEAQSSTSKSTSTSSTDGYSQDVQGGGVLGGSYLLKNISSTKGDGYESANIFVKSVSGSTNFPKYTAEISGNTIVVTIRDTRNYDIDTGANSYNGYNPLNINGTVIKSIKWEQTDESIIKIDIQLKYISSFKTVVLNSPLTLEVRVKK